MTDALHTQDAYLKQAPAQVIGYSDQGGVILDNCLFYATGGGQPGDRGRLSWSAGDMGVATTVKSADGPVLVPTDGAALPPIGTEVTQHLNWDIRHRHMRMHTALHLLSVVIPLPVTGGQIGAEKSRLDFAMETPPADKQAIEDALNALIEKNYTVSDQWITDEELAANPGLVKTMSVAPPNGAGRVRLVRIGSDDVQVDLQPCGGTHVAHTAEIGKIRIGKIEKKGKLNRRVALHLVD